MHRDMVTTRPKARETEEFGYAEEAIDVYCWRLEQLLGAGYSQHVSIALASDTSVDLHMACDLLTRGCCGGTAFRILV